MTVADELPAGQTPIFAFTRDRPYWHLLVDPQLEQLLNLADDGLDPVSVPGVRPTSSRVPDRLIREIRGRRAAQGGPDTPTIQARRRAVLAGVAWQPPLKEA